jgi:two-component system response regulator
VSTTVPDARHRPAPAVHATPLEILLVEDNPGDVLLTRAALKKARLLNHIIVASDGEEALAVLHREGVHAEAPRPHLLLLDLNLPRLSGLEVLTAIRQDPALASIAVVMLTSSAAERDVADAHALGVNGYITKPVAVEALLRIVCSIDQFWFTVVALPTPSFAS